MAQAQHYDQYAGGRLHARDDGGHDGVRACRQRRRCRRRARAGTQRRRVRRETPIGAPFSSRKQDSMLANRGPSNAPLRRLGKADGKEMKQRQRLAQAQRDAGDECTACETRAVRTDSVVIVGRPVLPGGSTSVKPF
jgi:hypothetical protein